MHIKYEPEGMKCPVSCPVCFWILSIISDVSASAIINHNASDWPLHSWAQRNRVWFAIMWNGVKMSKKKYDAAWADLNFFCKSSNKFCLIFSGAFLSNLVRLRPKPPLICKIRGQRKAKPGPDLHMLYLWLSYTFRYPHRQSWLRPLCFMTCLHYYCANCL